MLLKKCKIILLLVLLVFSFKNANAQEIIKIENVILGTKLQNHNITDITQDSQGFIWIATNWGLYRYDGYIFKEYSVTTSPSIIHNNVKSLLLDGDNLWIGTKGGITILDTRINETYNIPTSKLADPYVTKLFKDKNGTIWVGYFTNKLSKYLGVTKFQHFTIDIKNNNKNLIIKDIVETTYNKFYLKLISEPTNYSCIVEVKIDSTIVKSKLIIEKQDSDNLFIFYKYELLFAILKNKLYKLNPENEKLEFEDLIFEKDTVENSVLFVDANSNSNSNIYVGTKNSSFYNLNNETVLPENYTSINKEKTWINTFFLDKSDLLWVGTTNGLFKIKKNPIIFKKLLSEPSIDNYNKMRTIIQDERGDIYTVNESSLFKFDTIEERFINLNWKTEKNISNPYSLIENDENSLLVGTQNSGVIEYNKLTNSCKPYFKPHQKLNNNHVIKLFKDKNGILWIGTLDGLYYYDKKYDSLVLVNNVSIENDTENEIKEAIFDIQPYDNNNLWVGTSTGLYVLTVKYDEVPLKITLKEIKKIQYSIRSILIDKPIVWIATQTDGVLKYNSETFALERITENNGLSNNTVYSILAGNYNDLWFGTFNGLSRYDTIAKQFLNYYEYDGLANNEFNSSSQFKSKNGLLFFGGQNGISIFDPQNFKIDTTSFNLNLTTISWFDSKRDSTIVINVDNMNIKPLKLPYTNNFIKFEFFISEYFQPEKSTFRYRIIDFQNDWRVLENTNKLSFTNFPPGEYNLEVEASTNYGKWNKQSMVLPIIVEEIFYKKWWFISTLSIVILLFFYFVRRYELGHIKKMEQLRLRISRDLHDELGSSLTGIAMRSELINQMIDESTRNKFLNEISTQSRSAVDSLSDIVWALDSTSNSIQDLYDRMESILYKLLTPLHIKCFFIPYEENKNIVLREGYKQHLFLIFKEAITNIAKHSNATEVIVKVTSEKEKLKLTIQDNGKNVVDLKRDKLNGHGIKNMKLRAKKIKGELKISIDNGFKLELWFDF